MCSEWVSDRVSEISCLRTLIFLHWVRWSGTWHHHLVNLFIIIDLWGSACPKKVIGSPIRVLGSPLCYGPPLSPIIDSLEIRVVSGAGLNQWEPQAPIFLLFSFFSISAEKGKGWTNTSKKILSKFQLKRKDDALISIILMHLFALIILILIIETHRPVLLISF